MNLAMVKAVLAFSPPPTPPGTQPDPRSQIIGPLGMIVLMVVVFYVALIRPQQKRQKEHTELLKNIRPGDKIVTSGGVVATVVTVKEKTVTIRSADSKFEITKSSVAEITERSGQSNES